MQNNHDAAAPQEQFMKHHVEIHADNARIAEAAVFDAKRFVSVEIGLPEGSTDSSERVADLLQRRLSRLERRLGFDPICDH